MRQRQASGAAYADKLRASRKPDATGAVNSWRKHERRARPCCLIDRALQRKALVVWRSGADAEVRRIEAESRDRRGKSGSGAEQHFTAVDRHWMHPGRILRRGG